MRVRLPFHLSDTFFCTVFVYLFLQLVPIGPPQPLDLMSHSSQPFFSFVSPATLFFFDLSN